MFLVKMVSKRKSAVGQSRRRGTRASGQSILEVLLGCLVLVPIALAIIDLAVVVIGGEIVSDLAKQAARAAGNSPSMAEATTAVADVQSQFSKSPTYQNLSLKLTRYDGTYDGQTTVVAAVTVLLPVPIPFLRVGPTIDLNAQASDAIVSLPPPPVK